jgi:hypothetical protein
MTKRRASGIVLIWQRYLDSRLDATARVLELKEENSSAMGAYKSDSSVTMHSLAFLGSHSRWQALQAPLRITTQLYPPIESISSPSGLSS